ncbi:MAG: IS701 family transposase, partial [Burkholderiales bacterium]|nr:IS701 family transposase [Burkholderiales bacterium]
MRNSRTINARAIVIDADARSLYRHHHCSTVLGETPTAPALLGRLQRGAGFESRKFPPAADAAKAGGFPPSRLRLPFSSPAGEELTSAIPGDALGYSTRSEHLTEYCGGLMLPLKRKSVEPLAAEADPRDVPAKHQALLHFVANAPWADRAVLDRVHGYLEAHLDLEQGTFWMVDDTGHRKYGSHSVGVAHQYCGNLGKDDNCQVAVSLSLASARGSVPIDYGLYLPKSWAFDRKRRRKAGVPEEVVFQTKPQIALAQIRAAQARGVRPGVVIADAAYGSDTAWRETLTELGLPYAVGVFSSVTAWPPGVKPLPPARYRGRGRVPTKLRRGPGHEPISVKQLALQLNDSAWRTLTWREGTNKTLASRFARVRVHAAHHDYQRTTMRAEEWLLIEWPRAEGEPIKYWLSSLPADTPLERLVDTAKMRWRIEHDYHELKLKFDTPVFKKLRIQVVAERAGFFTTTFRAPCGPSAGNGLC